MAESCFYCGWEDTRDSRSKWFKQNLRSDYINHEIFSKLDDYIRFYSLLDHNVSMLADYIPHLPDGKPAKIFNFNMFILSSIGVTLESIRVLLRLGQLNDAYALLRKYSDSTTLNIYFNILILDKEENPDYGKPYPFVVEIIDKWFIGKKEIELLDHD